jgi:membrane protein implicated in regulation of membrane protease activity
MRVLPCFAFKVALPDNCLAMRARFSYRLITGLWITVLAGLLLAVDSLAAPGGGSSGFGGGGGGGGGGGFSGGGGAGSGGGSPWTVLVVFVIIVVFVAFGAFKAARVRKRRRERVARVELASAEAAGDDEYFAADDVKAEAKEMHKRIVTAWTGRDRDALARDLGPDLLTEWVRRLDDFDR